MSTCSFHATKVFHTAEGGALFTSNADWMTKAFQSHNFGHLNTTDFSLVGINAKISELQAAMGLSMLGEMDFVLRERKEVVDFYLQYLDFSRMQTISLREETSWNYSYFPVVFESELVLNRVVAALAEKDVFPRRYFYPSLNHLPYISAQSCPISESISSRILCLPLYVGLSKENLNNIVDIIHRAL